MEDPWFQQGLSREVVEANLNYVGEKVTGQKDNIMEVTEEGKKEEQSGVSSEITAFELASKLVMGSLSPLISTDQNVRRNAQFLASAKLDVAQAEVMKFLTEMKAKPQPGKNSNIKGFITDPVKGLITFNFQFVPTVCPDLTLVEVRRMRGDTLEFQKLYRNVVAALAHIVPCQPSVADALADVE
jgi:hypothetical protein